MPTPYLEMAQLVPEVYIRSIDEDRALLERALEHEGGGYTFEDVKEAVSLGAMQHWSLPHSVIITEIINFPNRTVFHIFLAAGRMPELRGALPGLLDYGRSHGATEARITGRPGWARSFLMQEGWDISPLVQLTKSL
jgi:hypothetical protein